MKMIPVLALSLSAASCALVDKPRYIPRVVGTAQEVYLDTGVKHDPYKGTTTIQTPILDPDGREFLRMCLRAIGPILQLYVVDRSVDWRYLENAADRDGTKLPVTVISRDTQTTYGTVVWCDEHVAVELTRAYLDARRETGLSIKVWGTHGECMAELPPQYVEGFLRRLDEIPVVASK